MCIRDRDSDWFAPSTMKAYFCQLYSRKQTFDEKDIKHWLYKPTRCSDDGEPSQTAGRPMLDVLLGEDLYDTAVVVTRYFGGTLLGTGGLVRAYSKAVQEGLANSCIIERKHGILLAVETDYNGIGRIQYLAGERRIPIQEAEYTEKVCLKLLVPVNSMDEIQKAITEGTSGKAKMRKVKELYFAEKDGEYLLYEI